MPNNYFRFKQFTINQGNTAMKVGTDGVLLGAWTNVRNARRILDIGTGTGLLALMMAQRCKALIDAVEINSLAAVEARDNFRNSPWSERINLFHTSFQEFHHNKRALYELVVCNPPYFTSSKKAPDSSRSLARHDETLSRSDLINGVAHLLTENGIFTVIVPFTGSEKFIELAYECRLYPNKILKIRPVPGKGFNRIIIEFGRNQCQTIESEMIIETGKRHEYSKEYINLTCDFYLKF